MTSVEGDRPRDRTSPNFLEMFLRDLIFGDVGHQVGPKGLALLMAIAVAEHGKQFKSPAAFFNSILASCLGLGSEDSLDRVRKKCVDRGWLVYSPRGGWRGPGQYQVKYPDETIALEEMVNR